MAQGISDGEGSSPKESAGGPEGLGRRLRTLLLGAPLDLANPALFRHLSLIALFAWVAVGSDLLSSACYGPPQAYRDLGPHRYLAVFLAAATVATVCLISLCYSHIIEVFPGGGGGYVVASKLLGPTAGVVSGCALLVDYVLTVTVSVASAGDALYCLLGREWPEAKLPAEVAFVLFLVVLNLRGLKESVLVLLPVFALFLLTHLVLVGAALALNFGSAEDVTRSVAADVNAGLSDPNLGLWGMLAVLLSAYSMGAGTYTGIEAVSNSMNLLREPRVRTARWTMAYMAGSMSVLCGGLLLAYLLLDVRPVEGRTINGLLVDAVLGEVGLEGHSAGQAFRWAVMLTAGAILVVAAQAGFVDGPRVLGYMARDDWVPRRFASLSERLTAHYGVVAMGTAAVALLIFSGGHVSFLIVMYATNVFVTFSLSMLALCRYWFGRRDRDPRWRRRVALFACGAVLCLGILVTSVVSKFTLGGWHTVVVTSLCVAACFAVRRHYRRVDDRLSQLHEHTERLALQAPAEGAPDPAGPIAAVLVAVSGGTGILTLATALRLFPGYFRGVVFVSVGVVDSGVFKGEDALEALRVHGEGTLAHYEAYARRAGLPATYRLAFGTDVPAELERLSRTVAAEFPGATFFAGNVVFASETWYTRLLHDQVPFALQRRLQGAGIPVIIVPLSE